MKEIRMVLWWAPSPRKHTQTRTSADKDHFVSMMGLFFLWNKQHFFVVVVRRCAAVINDLRNPQSIETLINQIASKWPNLTTVDYSPTKRGETPKREPSVKHWQIPTDDPKWEMLHAFTHTSILSARFLLWLSANTRSQISVHLFTIRTVPWTAQSFGPGVPWISAAKGVQITLTGLKEREGKVKKNLLLPVCCFWGGEGGGASVTVFADGKELFIAETAKRNIKDGGWSWRWWDRSESSQSVSEEEKNSSVSLMSNRLGDAGNGRRWVRVCLHEPTLGTNLQPHKKARRFHSLLSAWGRADAGTKRGWREVMRCKQTLAVLLAPVVLALTALADHRLHEPFQNERSWETQWAAHRLRGATQLCQTPHGGSVSVCLILFHGVLSATQRSASCRQQKNQVVGCCRQTVAALFLSEFRSEIKEILQELTHSSAKPRLLVLLSHNGKYLLRHWFKNKNWPFSETGSGAEAEGLFHNPRVHIGKMNRLDRSWSCSLVCLPLFIDLCSCLMLLTCKLEEVFICYRMQNTCGIYF